MVFSCRFPVPPSANHLFATRRAGGRTKTARYRQWQRDAASRLLLQRPPADWDAARRSGYSVRLEAGITRRRDLDNVIKPALDALQRNGVIPDDRAIDGIEASRAAAASGWLTVTVRY